MSNIERYSGLTFVEDAIGVDERRFGIVAPAIAQAIRWALEDKDEQGEDYTLESLDTVTTYAAADNGLSGPQIEKIYEYADAE